MGTAARLVTSEEPSLVILVVARREGEGVPSSGGGVAKGSGAVFAEGSGAGAHVGKERRASGRRGEDEADIDEVDGVKGRQPAAKDMAEGGRIGPSAVGPADFETMTLEAARDAIKK